MKARPIEQPEVYMELPVKTFFRQFPDYGLMLAKAVPDILDDPSYIVRMTKRDDGTMQIETGHRTDDWHIGGKK